MSALGLGLRRDPNRGPGSRHLVSSDVPHPASVSRIAQKTGFHGRTQEEEPSDLQIQEVFKEFYNIVRKSSLLCLICVVSNKVILKAF